MASSPRQRRRPLRWRRSRQSRRTPTGIPWAWLGIIALLYLSIGLLLAAFPLPYWIWNLALGGVLAQTLALAGPQALGQLRWWRANALVILAILGAALVAISLGISMGFVGTENLEEVSLGGTVFEVIRVGFLAIFLPAIGAIVTAETGDRLLYTLSRLQTTLVLAATCILGMGLGGAIGLLIAE